MGEGSELKEGMEKGKKGKRNIIGRCVGRGLYVAGAWGGSTCELSHGCHHNCNEMWGSQLPAPTFERRPLSTGYGGL
jgi:hypothetical protein